ncbi:MAG: TolB family protein [Draconibacterium sp.]
MKHYFLLLLFVFFLNAANAQYFQTGQDPASIRWRQINTENFQLIFPDYYEVQAQKLAQVLEQVYLKGGETLNHSPKKISVILHTQTVKSNGLVAYAPKRAEFYTIPHQDIYAQDWLHQLAIHEFRHVVQIDKINSELPKIIRWLLGEQGTALVFGAYLPWWFIEGDAVVTETAYSNSGRGRFPSFLMEHKALAVEKGNYKYDKAYNGSFKNYVPDHYQMGYYLVGAARQKYGQQLWSDVLLNVGKKPFSITPFNSALKKVTGFKKVQLYDTIFSELQNEWLKENRNFTQTEFEVISPQSKTFTSFRYNHWLNDSVFFSYRTALNRVPSFVKINSEGKVKNVYTPGAIFDESVSFFGEWIVWSERIPDARWQHSGKSLIRMLNIENKEKVSLKTEFTAFAPALSPDKSKIVVVESNFSSEYFLTVYQVKDGKRMHRFSTKNNNYFFSPVWLSNTEVAAVALYPEGKRLVKINFESDSLNVLCTTDLGEIKGLRVNNDSLFFIATYFGKNSLYQLNLKSGEVAQLFEGRFGVESPAISRDGGQILLSDYTSDGFRLVRLNAKNITEKKITGLLTDSAYPLAENLAKQENGILALSGNDTVAFPSKKYSKTRHLINFHSWAPVAVDADNYEIKPGLSLMSQNKLGTALLNIGYEWDVAGKTGNFYGKYTYSGWYPVFDFEINTGKNASEYAVIEQQINASGKVVNQDTILKRFTWNETNFSTDVRIPLDFSRGRFTRFIQPEIQFDLTKYKHDSTTPDQIFEGMYQSLSYRLYYQQLLRKSLQDVYPDFGFIGDFVYRHSPTGNTDLGNLTLTQAWMYLPGILPNHGIRLYIGGQEKVSSGSVGFADAIRYPRGWGKINTNQMVSFAGDYKLPLFYPEWSLGGLVYIQRVKAAVFADFARLNANLYSNGVVSGTFNSNISSVGLELTGDVNFLRFYAPVEIGFRSSYLPKEKSTYFDFLISIDFNSL